MLRCCGRDGRRWRTLVTGAFHLLVLVSAAAAQANVDFDGKMLAQESAYVAETMSGRRWESWRRSSAPARRHSVNRLETRPEPVPPPEVWPVHLPPPPPVLADLPDQRSSRLPDVRFASGQFQWRPRSPPVDTTWPRAHQVAAEWERSQSPAAARVDRIGAQVQPGSPARPRHQHPESRDKPHYAASRDHAGYTETSGGDAHVTVTAAHRRVDGPSHRRRPDASERERQSETLREPWRSNYSRRPAERHRVVFGWPAAPTLPAPAASPPPPSPPPRHRLPFRGAGPTSRHGGAAALRRSHLEPPAPSVDYVGGAAALRRSHLEPPAPSVDYVGGAATLRRSHLESAVPPAPSVDYVHLVLGALAAAEAATSSFVLAEPESDVGYDTPVDGQHVPDSDTAGYVDEEHEVQSPRAVRPEEVETTSEGVAGPLRHEQEIQDAGNIRVAAQGYGEYSEYGVYATRAALSSANEEGVVRDVYFQPNRRPESESATESTTVPGSSVPTESIAAYGSSDRAESITVHGYEEPTESTTVTGNLDYGEPVTINENPESTELTFAHWNPDHHSTADGEPQPDYEYYDYDDTYYDYDEPEIEEANETEHWADHVDDRNFSTDLPSTFLTSYPSEATAHGHTDAEFTRFDQVATAVPVESTVALSSTKAGTTAATAPTFSTNADELSVQLPLEFVEKEFPTDATNVDLGDSTTETSKGGVYYPVEQLDMHVVIDRPSEAAVTTEREYAIVGPDTTTINSWESTKKPRLTGSERDPMDFEDEPLTAADDIETRTKGGETHEILPVSSETQPQHLSGDDYHEKPYDALETTDNVGNAPYEHNINQTKIYSVTTMDKTKANETVKEIPTTMSTTLSQEEDTDDIHNAVDNMTTTSQTLAYLEATPDPTTPTDGSSSISSTSSFVEEQSRKDTESEILEEDVAFEVPTKTPIYLFSNFPEFSNGDLLERSRSTGHTSTTESSVASMGEVTAPQPSTESTNGHRLEDTWPRLTFTSPRTTISTADIFAGSGNDTPDTASTSGAEKDNQDLQQMTTASSVKEALAHEMGHDPGATSTTGRPSTPTEAAASTTRRQIPSIRSRPDFSRPYRFGNGARIGRTESTTRRVPAEAAAEITAPSSAPTDAPGSTTPQTTGTSRASGRKPSLDVVRAAIQPFSLAEMLVEAGQSLASFLGSDYTMADVTAVIERLRARREGRPLPGLAAGERSEVAVTFGSTTGPPASAELISPVTAEKQQGTPTGSAPPDDVQNVEDVPGPRQIKHIKATSGTELTRVIPGSPEESITTETVTKPPTESVSTTASSATVATHGRRRTWSLAEIPADKQLSRPEFLAKGGDVNQLLLEHNGVAEAEMDADQSEASLSAMHTTTTAPPGNTTKKVYSLAEILSIKEMTLKQFISGGGNVRRVMEEYNGVDWRPPTRAPTTPPAVTTAHVPAFLTRSTTAATERAAAADSGPAEALRPLLGEGGQYGRVPVRSDRRLIDILLQTTAPPIYGRPADESRRPPLPADRPATASPAVSASLPPAQLFERINQETESVWAAAGGSSGGGGDQYQLDSTVFDIELAAAAGGSDAVWDALITGGVVGGCALLFFIGLLLFCKWRQRHEQKELRPGLAVGSDRSSSPLDPSRINVNNYANAYSSKTSGFWGSLRKSFNQRYAAAYSESPYGGVAT